MDSWGGHNSGRSGCGPVRNGLQQVLKTGKRLFGIGKYFKDPVQTREFEH